MRRALGRGLSQLVADQFDSGPSEVDLDAIVPNQRQPRTHFKTEALNELAASIKQFGVLQPIVVKPVTEGRYELIAGERRFRACKIAGLKRVPVIIRDASDQASLELAVIENVQREDISPVESAKAYRRLMDEFDLTQDQVADRVGKSRASIANTVRLLRLSPRILDSIEAGELSEGHAKVLLSFDSEAHQLAVFNEIQTKGLTVRDVEKLAQSQPKKSKKPSATNPSNEFVEIESQLSMNLGSPVKIQSEGSGGKVVISYYSDDDLQRILEALGLN